METNPAKVTKYFQLNPLRLTELKLRFSETDKIFAKNTFPIKNKKYLFGIEVEVEGVHDPVNTCDYWNTVADGSLRNGGIEFVSHPLRGDQLEGALTSLKHSLPPTHKFSKRTSVHIHMNIRDLTVDEIVTLTTLYIALEKLLFRWVGHNRENNPFCIPIAETDYPRYLHTFIQNPGNIREYWNKYSALNLVPILTKGTIEFRHMHGTIDVTRLLIWISMLSALKDMAKKHTLKEVLAMLEPLNNTSDYNAFISYVFGDFAQEFNEYDLQSLLEHNITITKLMYIPIDHVNLELNPQFTATTLRRTF